MSQSHQKQALTFLLRRERGWAMDDTERDIWTKEKDGYGRTRLVLSMEIHTAIIKSGCRYINNVSGSYQDEPPPYFQGGLLADDMGLGKTLSMLCLIAANQAPKGLPSPPITPQPLEGLSYTLIKTTILIVPPPREYLFDWPNIVL
jgi:SWI/SNF-related matrix-associated actin-dependent regulator of chromatin subfamily A3